MGKSSRNIERRQVTWSQGERIPAKCKGIDSGTAVPAQGGWTTYTGYGRVSLGKSMVVSGTSTAMSFTINANVTWDDVCWHSTYDDNCPSCWDRARKRIQAQLREWSHDLDPHCHCTVCCQYRHIRRQHGA